MAVATITVLLYSTKNGNQRIELTAKALTRSIKQGYEHTDGRLFAYSHHNSFKGVHIFYEVYEPVRVVK